MTNNAYNWTPTYCFSSKYLHVSGSKFANGSIIILSVSCYATQATYGFVLNLRNVLMKKLSIQRPYRSFPATPKLINLPCALIPTSHALLERIDSRLKKCSHSPPPPHYPFHRYLSVVVSCSLDLSAFPLHPFCCCW